MYQMVLEGMDLFVSGEVFRKAEKRAGNDAEQAFSLIKEDVRFILGHFFEKKLWEEWLQQSRRRFDRGRHYKKPSAIIFAQGYDDRERPNCWMLKESCAYERSVQDLVEQLELEYSGIALLIDNPYGMKVRSSSLIFASLAPLGIRRSKEGQVVKVEGSFGMYNGNGYLKKVA